MSGQELFNLICSGKEYKGFFLPNDFKLLGYCSDQYAQYSLYQNSAGDIFYTRYVDMD